MIVSFRELDLAQVADAWRAFYPVRYAVDENLLKWNLTSAPTFDWGASLAWVEGDTVKAFVAFKRSSSALYAGPDPDNVHLSAIAFAEPTQGLDLMASSKRILLDRGVSRISFGQDSRHFFPGCPEDHRLLLDFLTIEGFEPHGVVFDLERDLSNYEPVTRNTNGFEIRPVSELEEDLLMGFLQSEFPGRCRYDVSQKAMLEGMDRSVVGAFLDDAIFGFAMVQDATHQHPSNGATWHLDMGEDWGALGPIGVAREVRGQGLGHALLSGALCTLRDRGARRTIIDWTTSSSFYVRHGFEISRRYRSMSLSLSN